MSLREWSVMRYKKNVVISIVVNSTDQADQFSCKVVKRNKFFYEYLGIRDMENCMRTFFVDRGD